MQLIGLLDHIFTYKLLTKVKKNKLHSDGKPSNTFPINNGL